LAAGGPRCKKEPVPFVLRALQAPFGVGLSLFGQRAGRAWPGLPGLGGSVLSTTLGVVYCQNVYCNPDGRDLR
jgi:hypothetical protein